MFTYSTLEFNPNVYLLCSMDENYKSAILELRSFFLLETIQKVRVLYFNYILSGIRNLIDTLMPIKRIALTFDSNLA